jgi:hypothetical protein
MNANPYEPPKALVADMPAAGAGETDGPAFFLVSSTKLVVLSLCTVGIYEYYWFYKNWRIIRDRTGEDISPFWRTFFALFYCYQLFDRVRKHSPELSTSGFPAGLLAAGWIILSVVWKLPDPYWLVTFLSVFILLPVQQAINGINQAAASRHDPNARFSGWNWVAVCLGGPLFLLALYGTLMPSQ